MIQVESDDNLWPEYNKEMYKISASNLKGCAGASCQIFKLYLAESLFNFGFLQTLNGDNDSALSNYDRATLLFKDINNQNGLAACYNNKATIFHQTGKIEMALELMNKALLIQQQTGNLIELAASMNRVGGIYLESGRTKEALELFQKSLVIERRAKDKKGEGITLSNIGNVYLRLGQIELGLNTYMNALKIIENLGDKISLSNTLLEIGNICSKQGEIKKSLELYQKAIRVAKEINYKEGLASAYNNIALIYGKHGDPEINSSRLESINAGRYKQFYYYNECISIRLELDDKSGLGNSFNNLGNYYLNFGDPEIKSSLEQSKSAGRNKALLYYLKALSINKLINSQTGIAQTLGNISTYYYSINNYNKALEYCKHQMKIGIDLGYPEIILNSSGLLSKLYKRTGEYKNALENYELFVKMRDSLNNESTKKASIKSQLKYEYEKQAAADSVAHAKESEIKNAELKKQEAEIKAKKNQQYALFGGLGLVMVFAGFMYNRFKITQKQKGIIESQKEIVEEQKKLVEEKQKEILDSIKYAKRIQLAQIPSERQLKSQLQKTKQST